MKLADGCTRPGWGLVSLAAFVYLLGRSLRILPLGTAYAVWTGIGAVGTVSPCSTSRSTPYGWAPSR